MAAEKNLMQYDLSSFVELLSSKEPAPGGGGAAALTGAQGTALAAMVCNLTIGKKKYREHEERLKEILEKALVLQRRFLEMIDEDKQNFLPLAKAYGIKAETEEEKREKAAVMEKALQTACRVPLEIVRSCAEGITLHEELLDKGSRLAISDVGVGAEFLRAALISGKMNVRINTGMMQDRAYCRQIDAQVDALVKRGVEAADRISRAVMEKI